MLQVLHESPLEGEMLSLCYEGNVRLMESQNWKGTQRSFILVDISVVEFPPLYPTKYFASHHEIWGGKTFNHFKFMCKEQKYCSTLSVYVIFHVTVSEVHFNLNSSLTPWKKAQTELIKSWVSFLSSKRKHIQFPKSVEFLS